ncbi:MAG: SMI1/KNR4 family protein [Leptonema illini]|uniref:SMI1/KNR4 family protein n=1 Tax=Leptonema illini TaxID=183 RepID=A0A833GY02_9LEPT|nr:MAG: SMI1/KNR4 family protein [Leptonema illini]
MKDWKTHIATMGFVKQMVMKADVKNMWPHHLPEIAATERQLKETENKLGYKIDEHYREFLSFADGWKGFYQTVDLFGTGDLLSGDRYLNAKKMLSYLENDVLERSHLERKTLMPIAATAEDLDLFVLVCPPAKEKGIIVWFAGDEIQRFDNFEEYFLAMIDYNRNALKILKEGAH